MCGWYGVLGPGAAACAGVGRHDEAEQAAQEAEGGHHAVAASPPEPRDQARGHRGEEEGARPRAAHADARGEVQPAGEVLAHGHHGRGVHQAEPHAAQHAVGEEERGEAGGVAGEEDGEAGHEAPRHARHPRPEPVDAGGGRGGGEHHHAVEEAAHEGDLARAHLQPITAQCRPSLPLLTNHGPGTPP